MTTRIATGWLAGLLLAALSLAPATAAADKTFFYNITSDDTWQAGMAVSHATAALEAGHEVALYLNVRGVRLVATDGEPDVFGPTGKTPRAMIRAAADKGARVLMCHMCVKKAGLTMDDLIEAAERARADAIFELMADDDTVVMSY